MNYYIIGLGPNCITKKAINKMKYVSKTMPFDWMFSSLTFIKAVLMDNFECLLDKSNITSNKPCCDTNGSYNTVYNDSILKSKNITNHLLIRNEICDYNNFHMWRHYNLLEEEQYLKYTKYVNRFKEVIQTQPQPQPQLTDLKVFLFIQYYDNDSIEEMVDLNEYLLENVTNYRFICIKCRKVEHKTFEFCRSYEKDNLYIYDLEIYTYRDEIEENELNIIKREIDTFLV